MGTRMIKLDGFIPIEGISGVNLWVLFSILPLMLTLTATVPEFHRGYAKYITWLAYFTLLLGLFQLNYELVALFNIQNAIPLIIYMITAIVGYCVARDEENGDTK